MPFTDLLDPGHILVIAHKGASGDAPENTIAAFDLAVEQGADVVELDVHMTADGHPVVIHDGTVGRTTNGSGQVRTKTLAELKELDAGSWFGSRFTGERIPTLDEVVVWARGKMTLAIELKNTPHRYRGIEASATGVLERRGALADHEVLSFDHQCVQRIKAREPVVFTGVCYNADPVDHPALAQAAEATALHPMFCHVRSEVVRNAHAAGLLVFPWVVDEDQDIRDMVLLGVDGITTNYPERARRIIEE